MSALPNLFNSVIGGALAKPGATVETVAAAIASSEPFLRAVRLGMSEAPPEGWEAEQVIRTTIAKAFSAGTASGMFDR
jgi:hypothetical protein